MRYRWLQLLLLGTFAFWATGAAKFAHERIEHHGGSDACVDDDGCDDDDGGAPAAAAAAPTDRPTPTSTTDHPKHACPVCQMLAAMVVDRSVPPALPARSLGLVATLAIADWQPPTLRPRLTRFATGPPVVSSHQV